MSHGMNSLLSKRFFGIALMALAAMVLAPRVRAQDTYIAFSVGFQSYSGNDIYSYINFTNQSRGLEITRVLFSLRSTGLVDYVSEALPPTAGTMSAGPSLDGVEGGPSYPFFYYDFTSFDPGEYTRFFMDIDNMSDFRTACFGVPGQTMVITVYSGTQQSQLILPVTAGGASTYVFNQPKPPRTLTIDSRTEDQTLAVRRVRLKINGIESGAFGSTNLTVRDGDQIEIAAPLHVYNSITNSDITDSTINDPQQIQQQAEERFTAAGIDVNNVSLTGDPTLYRFEIKENTTIFVKWRHEFALTVSHDFTDTESQDRDLLGNPWAGPLTSDAVGSPDPAAQKHWILKGTELIPQVDGAVTDLTRPGLDVRYVPKARRVWPNPARTPSEVAAARSAGVDIRYSPGFITNINHTIGQAPGRLQLPRFTMVGPVGITYVWQIQFGVRVSTDSPTHHGLAKVFQTVGGTNQTVMEGEGVYWFNRGAQVRVVAATNSPLPENLALAAWMAGDGFYFSTGGEIDSSDGSLVQGGPGQKSNGDVAAVWQPLFGAQFRGLHIPDLQRAAKVLWRYGLQQIRTHAFIGEHVFQGQPFASQFTEQPLGLTKVSVSGSNPNATDNDMAVWDPEAARLYPLVPGIFKARWRPVGGGTNAYEVIVTADYPTPAHYPHIAGTPPVALDPDPSDNFAFDSLKYSENQALVNEKLFTAATPGRSVLLFREIQRAGRGTPREFLRVRVVQTKRWDDSLPANGTAIIGRKITDPLLDLANLGTGFIMFDKARYNPFIYDGSKFAALAAKNVYDMDALRSAGAVKKVINKGNLAGPIIPVNLHPGAAN